MITLRYLREALSYDPDSGLLTWRMDRPRHHYKSENSHKIFRSRDGGKVAGGVNKTGYLVVHIARHSLLAHRIAFAIHHGIELGDLPSQIDHRDLDTKNNRISNLRPATANQNMHNKGMHANNSSGFKGVHWHKRHEKWAAKIKLNGRAIHLGYFASPESASAAREAAAKELHGKFARHATYLDDAA